MLSSPAVAHGRPPASHQRALGRGVAGLPAKQPPRPRGAAGELPTSVGSHPLRSWAALGDGAVPFPSFRCESAISVFLAAPPPYQERSMNDGSLG